jgi:glutathione S-transferase
MKSLDRRLAEQAFIAADRFTIADIVAVIGLDFARMIKYRPPEELTQLARGLAECRARPAAGAATTKAGPGRPGRSRLRVRRRCDGGRGSEQRRRRQLS